MVQTEKRLLWHPRHDNKFVVGGGSQITLYEWASKYPEIKHVTSQHDLNYMKCFAWSPDPAFDDLLAIGTSTGKVDLIRLEAGKQAQRKNVLSSGPSVTLPVRNSRACNALAFSPADPNYLAVGLDKVRGDSSLIIWDISTFSSSLTLPSTNNGDLTSLVDFRPPHLRPQPLLPRVETQNKVDARILQQHALTEIVSSLSFLPGSNHLLLTGISHRWLRLFDLRSPNLPTVNVASKVHEIATDPFDAHRIACFGDGVTTVWDARRLVQPIFTISERDALADGARVKQGSVYSHIEFSSTRRGSLATLERDASYIRFWDILESRVSSSLDGSIFGGAGGGGSSDGETRSSRDSSRAARRSWAANLPWPTGDRHNQAQYSPKEKDLMSTLESLTHQVFTLADTRRTKYFPRSLASFALVPNRQPHPLTSNVMVVNKDGDLELYAVHDTPKQAAWSARGDLAIGAGTGLKIFGAYEDQEEVESFTTHTTQAPNPTNSAFTYNSNSANSKPEPSRLSDKTSRSKSGPSREGSQLRGRSGPISNLPTYVATTAPPPLFGRGDEDGFPALPGTNLPVPTGLSVTRPSKQRTYSPASVRKYRQEPSGDYSMSKRRSPSRTDTIPTDDTHEESHEYGLNNAGPPRMSTRKQKLKDVSVSLHDGKVKGALDVIQDDISMTIRRRALKVYGLSQPRHNINVTLDDQDMGSAPRTLSELWAWIAHSQDYFCFPTPRLHGYDFSYQGLLGIWEGLPSYAILPQEQTVEETALVVQHSLLLDPTPPSLASHLHAHSASTGSNTSSGGSVAASATAHERRASRRNRSPSDDLHGDWSAALSALVARRSGEKSGWKPTVPTNKLLQRQIALQLCGWSLKEDEISAAIKRWEKEGKWSRAACWLVFTRQYSKAIELLIRSDDETHHMMSGTIASLAPHSSSSSISTRGLELREHYGRLIVRLNDPYFRAMVTHLVMGDWADVLDEDIIPFRERLAIAFQFLDDKALTSYLHRTMEQAVRNGSIEALIITGITPTGLNVLQSYVDRTGDVQSAALLSSYACPHRFWDRRAERWLEAYRDLLDGFKLFHHRVGFDIERGAILHEAAQNGDSIGGVGVDDWAPRQILIRCHYCNKSVCAPGTGGVPLSQQIGRPTTCDNCSRELPRCSICLMTLSIIHDAAREVDLGYSSHRDTFDDAIIICQTCRHGGHAVHIFEWFLGEDGRRTHNVCPVADCTCRCAEEY